MKMKTRSKTPHPTDPLDWVKKKEDPPGTIVRFVSDEIGKFLFVKKKGRKQRKKFSILEIIESTSLHNFLMV